MAPQTRKKPTFDGIELSETLYEPSTKEQEHAYLEITEDEAYFLRKILKRERAASLLKKVDHAGADANFWHIPGRIIF